MQYRNIARFLEEFSVYWLKLMNFIEQMAATDNGEISLAAIKNFKGIY